MGIQVEFNPDLALRDIEEFKNGNRKIEECIPEALEAGKVFDFLKSGQRNYWLHGELPLLETKGNGLLSRPKASIRIIEVTHFLDGDKVFTKGKYEVIAIFDDEDIHFESYAKLK